MLSLRRPVRSAAAAVVTLAVALLGLATPAVAVAPTGFVIQFDGLDDAIPMGNLRMQLAAATYEGDPGYAYVDDPYGVEPAAPGDYRMDLLSDRYDLARVSFTVVEGEVTAVTVKATTLVDLRGVVTYHDGTPATEKVTVTGASGTSTTWSDQQGRYWVQDLVPGDYAVTTDVGYGVERRTVSVEAGHVAVADVLVAEGGVVVGRATSPGGHALSEISLRVTDSTTGKKVGYGGVVQADGTSRARGVPDGHYDVTFVGSSYYQYGHAVVDVVDGRGFVPDVELARAAVVTGGVSPAIGATVAVYPMDSPFGVSGYVSASGLYSIGSLAPGQYRLYFDAEGYAPVVRVIDLPEGTTMLARQVLTRGDPVSGSVTRADGSPAAGVHVTGTQVDCVSGATVDLGHMPTTTTDAAGAFDVPAVPGGCYDLAAELDVMVEVRGVRAGTAGVRLAEPAAPTAPTPLVSTVTRMTTAGAVYGSPAKVSVVVTRADGGVAAVRGRVSLMDGSRTIAAGVALPSSGRVSLSVPATAQPGAHRLTAVFTPSAGFAGSRATASMTVRRATPTVTVRASHVKRGARTSIHVVVRASTPSTGTVTVRVGGHRVATTKLVAHGRSYVADVRVLLKHRGKVAVRYNGSSTIAPRSVTTKYVVR
ncbi:Ig-like domain repeat protein [Cellulomonas sp. HZM]|uniref:carboxypeptidase regulatory-like domain-containing protein n=1 Tax=Cellulomonas sp. HZM TaxID=1454010 RepID=UPI00049339AF|nr:Ig-like domain repeat protein [Cellulomonas sp. HZM]